MKGRSDESTIADAPGGAAADSRLTPPLKWAGGKRWQVPHLRPLWARCDTHRLVEPFCGGLAVSLALGPARALLSDANPHLINFYRWLKRGLRVDVPFENDQAAFYACRDRFNSLIDDGGQGTRDAALLFYYLNRTGYNGLCRFNASGRFNVPFGKYRRISYARDFSAYKRAFARWTFQAGDFAEVRLEAGDFVYADPPYDVPFTQYLRGGFGWSDQVRAAEWLARHDGPVVLVNQATPRILDLYRAVGFATQVFPAPRRISCTGDRTPAHEVIATRNIEGWAGRTLCAPRAL